MNVLEKRIILSKRILFLDPGGTTGAALFSWVDNKWYLSVWGAFETWTELPLLIEQADFVVYEHITATSTKFNTIGIEVIGVIKFLCNKYKKEYKTQQPSIMKGPYTYAKDFLNSKSKIPHEQDAIAHGIAYLGFENIIK